MPRGRPEFVLRWDSDRVPLSYREAALLLNAGLIELCRPCTEIGRAGRVYYHPTGVLAGEGNYALSLIPLIYHILDSNRYPTTGPTDDLPAERLARRIAMRRAVR